MKETRFTPEPDEAEEIETVRILAVNHQNKILLLQKSEESNTPGLYEFPGGKIDTSASGVSTQKEQEQTAIREMQEETGIDISGLSQVKINEFTYSFLHNGNPAKRKVHVFRVTIPGNRTEIAINKTRDSKGNPEDKHRRFLWVSGETLRMLKAQSRLSGNSQRFEKALGADGGEDLKT